jgi:hypothetical protein
VSEQPQARQNPIIMEAKENRIDGHMVTFNHQRMSILRVSGAYVMTPNKIPLEPHCQSHSNGKTLICFGFLIALP